MKGSYSNKTLPLCLIKTSPNCSWSSLQLRLIRVYMWEHLRQLPRQPRQRPSHCPLLDKTHHPASSNVRGMKQAGIPRATQWAIIATIVPLVPVLARHQTAHWEAVITTNIPPMPALARQQMARGEQAVTTTTQPSQNSWQNAKKRRPTITAMEHLHHPMQLLSFLGSGSGT